MYHQCQKSVKIQPSNIYHTKIHYRRNRTKAWNLEDTLLGVRCPYCEKEICAASYFQRFALKIFIPTFCIWKVPARAWNLECTLLGEGQRVLWPTFRGAPLQLLSVLNCILNKHMTLEYGRPPSRVTWMLEDIPGIANRKISPTMYYTPSFQRSTCTFF
jgi:hypothetical protein